MKAFSLITLLALFIMSIPCSAISENKVVVIPFGSSASSGGAVTTVFFDGNNNTNTDKRYAGIAGASSGSATNGHIFPMTRTGTVANFSLNISSNSLSAGNTVTIALMKNGSDTAITATYNDSTATGVTTIAGTVEYAAGDTFAVYAQQTSATSAGSLYFAGSFDIEY